MAAYPKPVHKKARYPKDEPSILQERKECWVCGDEGGYFNLQKHHIFGGSRRAKSAQFGCWVWLCLHHHTGEQGVERDRALDAQLKQACQRRFEALHGHGAWMVEFGKNYL